MYAPKAYVFIRSSTQSKEQGTSCVYDISSDVVSGSVTRNLNQPSTAEVVLRNRFKKWLRHPDNKKPYFLPMDMITIWLQRIAGHPIQVFTGYLDSVPYYQMYPNNCSITATCTLKRLAISYFDPGLDMFTQLMARIGFTVDPSTGEGYDVAGIVKGAGQHQLNAGIKSPGKINDGGFAKLLYTFMTEIAAWNENMVLIGNLPENLGADAAKLYNDISVQTDQDLSHLQETMKQIMGLSFTTLSPSNGITNAPGTSTPSGLLPGVEKTTRVIKLEANKKNIPLVVPITAAILLSGYDPRYKATNPTTSKFGYGLFALSPSKGGRGTTPTFPGGYNEKQIMTPDINTKVFLSLLQKSGGSLASGMKPWIETTCHKSFSQSNFTTALEQATTYVKLFQGNGASTSSTAAPTQSTDLTWTSPTIQNLVKKNHSDKNAYSHYISSLSELAPYYWYAKTQFKDLSLYWSSHMTGNTISITGPNGELANFFDSVGKTKSPDVVSLSNVTALYYYRNQKKTTSFSPGTVSSADVPRFPNTVTITTHAGASYPTFGGKLKPTSQSTQTTSNKTDIAKNGLTVENFATLSLDAAFTAQFAFPVNYIESHFLTGHKALMNDVPCLDAVDQFCKASLRTFCSLPDGRFLAFYPDYFGAHGRHPYWSVTPIELRNMGIQLNDDSLATHVYVVGDTFGLDSKIDEFDYIGSRGVVTLDMHGVLDAFITPLNHSKKTSGDTSLGDHKTALEFMSHYGARPYKEEQPLIRNSFFEFLMAYQRFMQLWSTQFATTVDFTFQPEIIAGGLVEFLVPEENTRLRMFVQGVTHTWDYSSGFDTSAKLTSPSITRATGDLPGFALAGGVNSVGTAE